MKSILIIGLGRFGHHLANYFLEMNNEVMIIDIDEKKVEDLAPYATSTKIGDCTNASVLKGLGIGNFDIVFVCIGTNFQSSLEVTSLAKELGAKKVISKVTRDIQAKFLLRNGADEVVYPDKNIAERIALKYTDNNIYDYIEMDEENVIAEIPPLKEWVDKTIRESNIAAKYKISIMGVKRSNNKTNMMPSADYVVRALDHLIVLGEEDNIKAVIKHL